MLLICTHHGIGFVCEVSALGHFKSIARSALCLNDRTLVDRTRSRNLDGTVVAQRQRTGIGDLAGGKRTRNGSCTGSLDGGQFAGGQFARNVKRAGIDSCRFNGKLRTTSDRVGAARCVRLTSLEGADNNAFSLQVAALRDVAALRKDAAETLPLSVVALIVVPVPVLTMSPVVTASLDKSILVFVPLT